MFSWAKFEACPIMGIMRGFDKGETLEIANAYDRAGLTTLEVTLNSEDALNTIAQLKVDFPSLNIGAGTICTLEDLESAIEVGASFIVTPIVDREVIARSVSLDVPIVVGAFTPSEIYKAWSLGASAVKVFPASRLGVSYMREVLGPFNDVKLIPTGGVDMNNIHDYFQSGVFGVGMGGSLFDAQLIAIGDYSGLEVQFRRIAEAVLNAKGTGQK